MAEADVANEANTRVVTDENRIPMSLPNLQLQVPAIEGYEMHWFADRPGRINRARAAGWVFVDPSEVSLNNFGLAADLKDSGNTDLGTRVSVHGGTAEHGGAERLYLMKIKKEWYDKDMSLREDATEKVVQGLRSGMIGADKTKVDEMKHRYGRKENANLFTKKQPRR